MGKINVLSFAVANLIAAGEVVDRPASVIKELMENAIDSSADKITVEIQNGGVSLMRVRDNGCGIERDDLPVAVRRHATSKIHDARDLESIMTLGFRGEALAAIAAVSDLRIISRVRGQPTGAGIEVSGGVAGEVYERGCSEGTTVIVENLFGNVPARRKFLKKDVTETAAVHSVVERVALSRPDIAFDFIVDGNSRLQTAGDGKLLNTIYALYGRDYAKRLIPVEYEYEGISVRGYTGRSDNVKPNRNGQTFYINDRLVKSRTVMAALEQAYCSYIPPEKFPVCTLFIDINPRAVDVNVHPAKLEVKFSNEKPVFEAVYYAIKQALESNTVRPDIPVEKLSHMSYEQFRQMYSVTGAAESSGTAVVSRASGVTGKSVTQTSGGSAEIPVPAVKTHGGTDNRGAAQYGYKTPAVKTYQDDPPAQSPQAAQRSDDRRFSTDGYIALHRGHKPDSTEVHPIPDIPPVPDVPPVPDIPSMSEPPMPDVRGRKPVQQRFQDGMPDYRIVGEVFNCYVIVERGEQVLLIDKHAAHERIIFEDLKAGLRNTETHSQLLMVPLEFMLASDEVMALGEFRNEIEAIGFRFTTEKYTVSVTSVPETIELASVPDIFMTIADRVRNQTGSAELTRDIIFEKALYQASCKAAVKGGREYSPEHIQWIVDKLMKLSDITFCPHGRPVAMVIKKSTLDRQFGRT